MNKRQLASVIRRRAMEIYNRSIETTGRVEREDADDSELLNVLARIIEGKPIDRAFGAPGDWGYGTPIGDALAAREPVRAEGGAS